MEYCPINYCEKDNDKVRCSLCKGKHRYYLEDVHQRRYPLYGDEDCRMHLLSDQPYVSHKQSADAKCLVFFDETNDEIKDIMKKMRLDKKQEMDG